MSLFQWLLPKYCQICAISQAKSQGLCEACLHDLPWLKQNGCPVCALPMQSGLKVADIPCGECQSLNPAYDTIIAPFYYQQPASSLIRSLKFSNQLPLGKLCAEFMLQRVLNHYQNLPLPQLLLPVPLHKRRLHRRGFNQSIIIGKRLSQKLRIPMSYHILSRIKPTSSQTGLNKKQRRRNVRKAFSMQPLLNIQHVALIDDVVTTGATVNELCKLLKNQGIKRVDVWCFARTPREDK